MNRRCLTCAQQFHAPGKARYCSPDCRHGTDAGYNAGCGCTRCLAAHARNHKRLRLKPRPLLPAIGTQRRIQALARLGWSTADLSRQLGRNRSYLLKVLDKDTLEATTVLMVRRLYDELSMTWCTSRTANRTAATARSKRWPPPLAWDDSAIDDPAGKPRAQRTKATPTGARRPAAAYEESIVGQILAGDWRTPASKLERAEVARRWHAAGNSLSQLQRLTGWKVERYFKAGEAA